MRKSPMTVAIAFLFTILVPVIGYLSFGPIPATLFLVGYLGGFVGWIATPSRASYDSIKIPYLVTFLLFIGHRVEEKVSGFFQTLAEMTGVPVPEIVSAPIIILLVLSVAAWILGPFLMRLGSEFGDYLVWTFFASMGITELAHFIFPLYLPQPYGYFPGMISVVFLAPSAWWGIWRLRRKNSFFQT